MSIISKDEAQSIIRWYEEEKKQKEEKEKENKKTQELEANNDLTEVITAERAYLLIYLTNSKRSLKSYSFCKTYDLCCMR